MKEKNYTFTIDVQVTKTDNNPRWYSLKIYGHPLTDNPSPLAEYKLSNMREEQARKVGDKLLGAIYTLVENQDSDFWKQ